MDKIKQEARKAIQSNKTIRKEFKEMTEEIFDAGKRYGEDLGYVKDDVLYELRSETLQETRQKLNSILLTQLQEVKEMIEGMEDDIYTEDDREQAHKDGYNKALLDMIIALDILIKGGVK